MKVLIYDECSNKPYQGEEYLTEAFGGSEAAAQRLAANLNKLGLTSKHWQPHFGPNPEGYQPDCVIAMRLGSAALRAKQHYPEAKVIVWMHDRVDQPALQDLILANQQANARIVVVSDWHRRDIVATACKSGIDLWGVRFKTIYNTLLYEEYAELDVVPGTACFVSSPHKGLMATVSFLERYNKDPKHKKIRLKITNPGYLNLAPKDREKVVSNPDITMLNSLNYVNTLNLIGSSELMINLGQHWEETFGMVYVEAAMLGTPVVCGRYGAIEEVAGDAVTFCDVKDYYKTCQAIEKARKIPRINRFDRRFSKQTIYRQWVDLITA